MSMGIRRVLCRNASADRIRALLLGSAAVAWALNAVAQTVTPAQSQAASSASTAAGDQIPEIVVTALKRDTDIQQTPLAISAIAGDSLAAAGITDVSDLRVPSLTFVQENPSLTRVVVRGIYSVGESTTGVYYDEAPVTGAIGAGNDAGSSIPLVKLFDVQRVEVLQGPQGTLFGSGSMGGAVRVIFNKPDLHDYSGAFDVDGSSVYQGGVGGSVSVMGNFPLIENMLAVRVVGYDSETPGYVDNIVLNQRNTNISHSQGGRFLARFQPNDNFTLDASFIYQHSFGGDGRWDESAGNFKSTFETQLPYDDVFKLYNITAHWDLGVVAATAVVTDMQRRIVSTDTDVSPFFADFYTGANAAPNCAAIDNNGAPCSAAQQTAYNTHVNSFIPSAIEPHQTVSNPTVEVRLASNTKGFLDWTVGGYYSDRQTHVDNPIYGANAATGALDGPQLYLRQIDDELTEYAAFGEASAHLVSGLTLTFGARYFDYSRTVGGDTAQGLDLLGVSTTPYGSTHSNQDGFVTKTNLSYQFDKDFLVYAEASQGFRPGGVNQVIGLPTQLTPYQSDSLWDYEIGAKTSWFDNHLTFDIDAFVIDWSNMQVLGFTPDGIFQFVTNAGAAQIKGIEVELVARPVTGLSFSAHASPMHAVLSENQVSPNVLGPGVKGDHVPFTPNLSGGVSAEYNWPVNDGLVGMARLDENYVGSSNSEFNNSDGYDRRLSPYALTNGRVGVESPGKKLGVYIYVNNMFDRVAINFANAQLLAGDKTLVSTFPPRTVGVNLTGKF
jgi:iron complex outermembrane receptor protein